MSKNVIVFTEHTNGKIKKASLATLTKGLEIAGKLGSECIALMLGSNFDDSNKTMLGEYGIKKAYTYSDPKLENYNPVYYKKLVTDFLKEQDAGVFLGLASTIGQDLFPRIGADFDTGIIADCTDISCEDGLSATRPIFAGKCLNEVKFSSSDSFQIATIRPNVLAANKVGGGECAVESKPANLEDSPALKILELIKGASGRPDLTEAEIIVSGGRAMKEKENFKIIEELADVLGASVGASRAAVDAGYAPQANQVGQTGKTVNPKIYIACGISGAIQHLAGMRTSKVIVAINKDKEAPIFELADYGIVGDLFKVVPVLTEEFKKLLKE